MCNVGETRGLETDGSLGVVRATNGSSTVDEIPFHKHCQKTVCSAYQGGDGYTWNIIDTLTLDNLSFIDVDGGWKSFFTRNDDNIT